MSTLKILEIVSKFGIIFVAFLGSIAYAYGRKHGQVNLSRLILAVLGAYAVAHVLFIIFIWINHITFPLNLEAMELTILQHVKRAMDGLPIYAEPSPDFVSLIYNPLYYLLTIPFAWILGPSLFTLRLVSILGMSGAGLVIFLAVRRETGSNWWGLIALGLFAAAYGVMDTYLDNAHADSWTLFSILLGCYLIEQNRSQSWNLIGIICTIAAFWFKQYGAVFTLGAILFLTWRDGWRKALPAWIMTVILGPGLYFVAGPWLFGPYFLFYTWQVPRQWIEFGWSLTILRVVEFVAFSYAVLAVIGSLVSAILLLHLRQKTSVWYFMLPLAVLSAFYVALDPGNNNNVFIPLGVCFILTGVMGLRRLIDRFPRAEHWGLHLFALGTSFALLLYNPVPVIAPFGAASTYHDLVTYLQSLDGTVYAPTLGQLQDGYQFYPAVHWVPMVDLYRGPKVDLHNHPIARNLLEPVLHAKGQAYILIPFPLEADDALAFLGEAYIFEADLGERFAGLQTLPKRFMIGYPRYLYRYAP